jgi:hypothetical protein
VSVAFSVVKRIAALFVTDNAMYAKGLSIRLLAQNYRRHLRSRMRWLRRAQYVGERPRPCKRPPSGNCVQTRLAQQHRPVRSKPGHAAELAFRQARNQMRLRPLISANPKSSQRRAVLHRIYKFVRSKLGRLIPHPVDHWIRLHGSVEPFSLFTPVRQSRGRQMRVRKHPRRKRVHPIRAN